MSSPKQDRAISPIGIFSGSDTDAVLHSLGVTSELLWTAIEHGKLARANCNAFHPRWYAGARAHAEATMSLRMSLHQSGWTECDDGGQAATVSPRGHQIVVATADCGCGTLNPVRTKNPRGAVTETRVSTNRQLFIPFVEPEYESETEVLPAIESSSQDEVPAETWLLLFYFSEELVRAELSLPTEMIGGHVTEWRTRILLGERLNEQAPDFPDHDHDGPADLPDVSWE